MAGSLRRWGQLAPVVACVRDEQLELLDGFKRQAAACRRWAGLLTIGDAERAGGGRTDGEVGDFTGLNRGQRPTRRVGRKRGSCRPWCGT